MPNKQYRGEYAGAAAAAALPTAAAIQKQMRLQRLKELIQAAPQLSYEQLHRMSRVGDVITEGQPAGKILGGPIARGTLAIGSPLTHAEFIAPGRRAINAGHETAIERFNRATGNNEVLPAPDDMHFVQRLREWLATRRRGSGGSGASAQDIREALQRASASGKSYNVIRDGERSLSAHLLAGQTPKELVDTAAHEEQPLMLLRRALGGRVTSEEAKKLKDYTKQVLPAEYGTSRIMGSALKGLFMPEVLLRGAARGCKVNPAGAQICSSGAGNALKMLGGLQQGRNVHTLPISLAVDPNVKVMGVANKAALLKRLTQSRLGTAGLSAGAIGLTGLGGYKAVEAFKKHREGQQPLGKAKNWLTGIRDKALGR